MHLPNRRRTGLAAARCSGIASFTRELARGAVHHACKRHHRHAATKPTVQENVRTAAWSRRQLLPILNYLLSELHYIKLGPHFRRQSPRHTPARLWTCLVSCAKPPVDWQVTNQRHRYYENMDLNFLSISEWLSLLFYYWRLSRPFSAVWIMSELNLIESRINFTDQCYPRLIFDWLLSDLYSYSVA